MMKGKEQVNTPIVKFKKMAPEAIIPKYAKPGDAGMDLHCMIPREGYSITIIPGERRDFQTGLQAEIPPGYEGQIRPRSGWSLKDGISVINSPGTIDQSFRGEIRVLLINHGSHEVTVYNGDRIAQLVISPVASAEIVEAEELSTTERGTDGLGSTGK